jgi:hypothetical protein
VAVKRRAGAVAAAGFAGELLPVEALSREAVGTLAHVLEKFSKVRHRSQIVMPRPP